MDPPPPEPTVALRRATTADAEMLLALRNDGEVRRQSWQGDEVDPAEHRAWLAGKLADDDCRLYVIVRDEPIGQLRLDRRARGLAEISISLVAGRRGRGFGREAIKLGCDAAGEELGVSEVVAEIKPGNAPSQAAFAAAGFVETARDERRVVMARHLE
jgi:RimJ/RimL family protein N-acetyltransferase